MSGADARELTERLGVSLGIGEHPARVTLSLRDGSLVERPIVSTRFGAVAATGAAAVGGAGAAVDADAVREVAARLGAAVGEWKLELHYERGRLTHVWRHLSLAAPR